MNIFIENLKKNFKIIDIRDLAKECEFITTLPKKEIKLIRDFPKKEIKYNYLNNSYNNDYMAAPQIEIYYNDDEIVKNTNYNLMNYEQLKQNQIYCRENKLKSILIKYINNDIENLYHYITINKTNFNDYTYFCKINIEKCIRIFIDNNIKIIDSDLKLLNVKTKQEILDEEKKYYHMTNISQPIYW